MFLLAKSNDSFNVHSACRVKKRSRTIYINLTLNTFKLSSPIIGLFRDNEANNSNG